MTTNQVGRFVDDVSRSDGWLDGTPIAISCPLLR
jgi:hypothetical protein